MQAKADWMKRCVHMAAELHRREREGRGMVAKAPKRPRRTLMEKLPKEIKPAIAMVDANRFAEAREFVADYLEGNPRNAAGHAFLIRIHGMLGEVEVAEHLFGYARKNGMGSRGIHCALVDAYANCGRFGDALEVIFKAAECGMDDIRSYMNFMSRLYAHGMYREMLGFHSFVPAGYREKPPIMVRYADALRKLGRLDEAMEAAELSLRMRGTLGDSTLARIIIGYCEIERENPERAYELLNGIYERISSWEDGGLSFRLFPRLICGLVFACREAFIEVERWKMRAWLHMLRKIEGEGRGKPEDVHDAIADIEKGSVPAKEEAGLQHAL